MDIDFIGKVSGHLPSLGRNLTKGHNFVRLLDKTCPFTALRLYRRALAYASGVLVYLIISLYGLRKSQLRLYFLHFH